MGDRASSAASFTVSLLAGSASVWLGWRVLAGLGQWLDSGLASMLAALLALPAMAHVGIGRLVPRTWWAMAAAPFSAFTFVLPFAWQNRGDDVTRPEDVTLVDLLPLALFVALLAGVVLAGFVALGAAWRAHRLRGPAGDGGGHPPYP